MADSHALRLASESCDARSREILCSSPAFRPGTPEWATVSQLGVLSLYALRMSWALETREEADATLATIFTTH